MMWTEELEAEVKALWEDHSATQIAIILNARGYAVTRNSIIGKLHRLKLTVNDKKKIVQGTVTGVVKVRAKRDRKPTLKVINGSHGTQRLHITVSGTFDASELRCAEVTPLEVNLLDLRANQCRAPYGEGPLITFCGHPTLTNSSYCTPHHFLYIKPQELRGVA